MRMRSTAPGCSGKWWAPSLTTTTSATINLTDISAVTWHVASGGVGGKIELHANSADGPLLAEDEVRPTGGWSKFENHRSAFSKVCTDDRADLFVVFKNPGKGGLMNLEWLQFEPK